jgi:hypothetical protein
MGKTLEFIDKLFEGKKNEPIGINGECHDCKKPVNLVILYNTNELEIHGGAIYKTEREKPFFKCKDCLDKDQILRNYQECEVYSRVVGYIRPVRQYNNGKKAEFRDRKNYIFH